MGNFKNKWFNSSLGKPGYQYDLDNLYDRLKDELRDNITRRELFYDDRSKMFLDTESPHWNSWVVISYNQNRIMGHLVDKLGPVRQAQIVAEYCAPDYSGVTNQLESLQNQVNQLTASIGSLMAHYNQRPVITDVRPNRPALVGGGIPHVSDPTNRPRTYQNL